MTTSTSSPRPRFATRTSLEKITPPTNLSVDTKQIVFDHLFAQIADWRNTREVYADLADRLPELEAGMQPDEAGVDAFEHKETVEWRREYTRELNRWAQSLAQKAWVVCCEKEEDTCPTLGPYVDTSTARTASRLPSREDLGQLLNAILFVHLTTEKEKRYSALTRAFFYRFGYADLLDEDAITWVLKNPEKAVEETEAKQKAEGHNSMTTADVESIKQSHAEKSSFMRNMGIGLGAIAGGVLVGVTGGLAAPLVGAGIASVLGIFGLGGSILGLIATGLAGSGVVCGALFGVYGARSTAEMVERHVREVRDLEVLPVRTKGGDENEHVDDTLGVRLCISGWLNDKSDVTEPWKVFGGDDTFALQWEMEALKELSDALVTLVKSEAWNYVKGEVIKRTVFAAIMASLAPLALLKIGRIVDNPWMNAKARAQKTGAVLGELLLKRAFGNRPVTLVGYSLGALVIHEALLYLAEQAPSESGSIHMIQDVYLFGTPVSSSEFATIRTMVAGRVINGYATDDYVLGVLSRASAASWEIAGLGPVDVKGVENVHCEEVKGHLFWRTMVGKCLLKCNVPGVIQDQVEAQQQQAPADFELAVPSKD